MTQHSKFTYDDLVKEIDQRFNRLSGGASILALRNLLKDGQNEPAHQFDRLQSVQSEIIKISQPTAGRTEIVKDIINLINVYIDSETIEETANEKLKNAKLSYDEKITSGEIVDKTTKEDANALEDVLKNGLGGKGVDDENLSEEEIKERQSAIDALNADNDAFINVTKEDSSKIENIQLEDIKIEQTSKAFTGKKTKLTKAFLSKQKDLDFLSVGEFVYIDGHTITAFIVSKRFAESDKNVTGITEDAVFIFDKPLQLV